MTKKKMFNWLAIFGLLTAFSFTSISGYFRSPVGIAMAKMADENDHGKAGGFVVAEVEDEESHGFLQRFMRLTSKDLVCEVDAAQLASLSALYTTEQDTITVNGSDVPVVKVSSTHKLKQKDIKSVLESSGSGKLKCQVLKNHNIFYLLFSANMS